MRQTIDKLAAKLVTLFTAAALFVALLLGGAGVPAQAAMPANDGKFYSDFLSYEESLAAGRDANAEIASEGITLLKNENDVLPLKDVKYVSVFGKNGVDPYYHGFGAGAAQSTLDPVTLYDGLEMAGYKTNSVLKAFYENDARSGSDRTIGELIGEAPVEKYDAAVKRSFELYDDAAIVCISRAVNEGKDAVRAVYAEDFAIAFTPSCRAEDKNLGTVYNMEHVSVADGVMGTRYKMEAGGPTYIKIVNGENESHGESDGVYNTCPLSEENKSSLLMTFTNNGETAITLRYETEFWGVRGSVTVELEAGESKTVLLVSSPTPAGKGDSDAPFHQMEITSGGEAGYDVTVSGFRVV